MPKYLTIQLRSQKPTWRPCFSHHLSQETNATIWWFLIF